MTEDREAIKGCIRRRPTIMLVRAMLALVRAMLWFIKKLGG